MIRTGKLYALKKSINKFRGPRDRDSFIREIKLVGKLVPHKNIVKYDRAWQDAGYFYIAMELCARGTLSGLLEQTLWIDLPQIRNFMQGFLSGLDLLHTNNLIHLDLKPENLFLSDDGGIKIGDFGLCRLASEWDSEGGDGAYLAPEVLNDHATSASDVFSAGLILFLMMYGIVRLPGHGSEWQRLRSGDNLFLDIPQERKPFNDSMVLWHSLSSLCSSMLSPCFAVRPTAQNCLAAKCFLLDG